MDLNKLGRNCTYDLWQYYSAEL